MVIPHFLQTSFILFVSRRNIDFQNYEYWLLNSLDKVMQSPWSRITIWKFLLFFGCGLTKTLPGCGSQCTNPVTNIWSAKARISLFIIYFLLYPNLFNSFSSVILIPSIHSETITLSRVNSSIIRGTWSYYLFKSLKFYSAILEFYDYILKSSYFFRFFWMSYTKCSRGRSNAF